MNAEDFDVEVGIADDQHSLAAGLLGLWDACLKNDEGVDVSYRHDGGEYSNFRGLEVKAAWLEDEVVWRIPSWKGYGFRDWLCDVMHAFDSQAKALKKERDRHSTWSYRIFPANSVSPKRLVSGIESGIVKAKVGRADLAEDMARGVLRNSLLADGYAWLGSKKRVIADGKTVEVYNFVRSRPGWFSKSHRIVSYYVEVSELTDVVKVGKWADYAAV